MEWYQSIFGGELQTSPHTDQPGLMHAHLHGGMIDIMACDGTRTTPYETCRITLSLNGTDAEVITKAFNDLSEGATEITPLKTESWGDTFGTLTDRFGIDWMVNIAAE